LTVHYKALLAVIIRTIFAIMLRTLLISLICLLVSSLHAQNKKKQKYDTYWAEQAKLEGFEALKDSAHKFFQRGHLELAMSYYDKALKEYPNDQFTKAKIQDLQILEQDISEDIMGLMPKIKEDLRMSPEDIEDTLRRLEELTLEYRQQEFEPPAQDSLPEQAPEIPNDPPYPPVDSVVKQVQKEIPRARVVDLNEKEVFNINDFKEQLLKEYPNGVTEETVEKKRSTIYRRVVVRDGDANEYLKVVHSYGATFYFKNKQSVTQNVWLKEAFPDR
jgi:tetratricopeptide (TPR) repeat protein